MQLRTTVPVPGCTPPRRPHAPPLAATPHVATAPTVARAQPPSPEAGDNGVTLRRRSVAESATNNRPRGCANTRSPHAAPSATETRPPRRLREPRSRYATPLQDRRDSRSLRPTRPRREPARTVHHVAPRQRAPTSTSQPRDQPDATTCTASPSTSRAEPKTARSSTRSPATAEPTPPAPLHSIAAPSPTTNTRSRATNGGGG